MSAPDLRLRLRLALDRAGGARVIVDRTDLAALLDRGQAGEPGLGSVALTEDLADLLAEAAWETATHSRVARFGHWHDAHDANRAATLDAARRTLRYLITGEVQPEPAPATPATEGHAA